MWENLRPIIGGHTGRCNMDKSICNTGRALMTAGMGQKGGQA